MSIHNRKKLNAAIAEAQRFIERAKLLPVDADGLVNQYRKESGAIRRSSMELTRALADLRKVD